MDLTVRHGTTGITNFFTFERSNWRDVQYNKLYGLNREILYSWNKFYLPLRRKRSNWRDGH